MADVKRGEVLRDISRLYHDGPLFGLNDGQLLERYLARHDDAAFEALVRRHGPMVLGVCRRRLRNPSDIEDAFQATFLILVRKAPGIRDRGLLCNWLYGVADRVARRAQVNTLRRRDREFATLTAELAVDREAAVTTDIGPELDCELKRLPAKYRAPLILCYLEGHTHDGASEVLKCPVGTVRSRLARGRDLLRRRLERRGFAPALMTLGDGSPHFLDFLIETVPTAWIPRTVTLAGRACSQSLLKSAAGVPAVALAQGVLTTMKMMQFQWIGIAFLATSLPVGTALGVRYAAAQAPASTSTQTVASAPQAPSTSPAPKPVDGAVSYIVGEHPEQAIERYIVGEHPERAIERKVDQFLREIGMVGSDGVRRANSDASVAANVLARKLGPLLGRPSTTAPQAVIVGGPIRTDLPPRLAGVSTNDAGMESLSANTLGVELKLAIEQFRITARLSRQRVISKDELVAARNKVLLAKASLDSSREEMQDEADRLQFQIEKMKIEIERSELFRMLASVAVARNKRLTERKPGTISEFDLAKDETELQIADIDRRVKSIEHNELKLREQKLLKRLGRVTDASRLAASFESETRQTLDEIPDAPK